MYGNDYMLEGESGPIVGPQFLDLLKNLKGRLIHDEHDEENFFEIKYVKWTSLIFMWISLLMWYFLFVGNFF